MNGTSVKDIIEPLLPDLKEQIAHWVKQREDLLTERANMEQGNREAIARDIRELMNADGLPQFISVDVSPSIVEVCIGDVLTITSHPKFPNDNEIKFPSTEVWVDWSNSGFGRTIQPKEESITKISTFISNDMKRSLETYYKVAEWLTPTTFESILRILSEHGTNTFHSSLLLNTQIYDRSLNIYACTLDYIKSNVFDKCNTGLIDLRGILDPEWMTRYQIYRYPAMTKITDSKVHIIYTPDEPSFQSSVRRTTIPIQVWMESVRRYMMRMLNCE